MNRRTILRMLLMPAAVGLVLGSSAIASAQTVDAESNFGQHVSQCAHMVGFGADHNPGMHRGKAGWDGMPC